MQALDRDNEKLGAADWLIIAAAALAAVAVKIALATQRGFWLDEYWTFQAITRPVPELIRQRLEAGHSPLAFLYAKLFLEYGGSGERALRASSALAGGLAAIGACLLAVRLGLRRHLPTIAALCVLHPYWHRVGIELRYMMPLIATSAWWLWFHVDWIRRESRAGLWGSALMGGLTLWLHSSAQFLLVAVAVHAFAHAGRGNWRRGAALARPSIYALVLSAPLLWALASIAKGDDPRRDSPDIAAAFNHQIQTLLGVPQLFSNATGLPDFVPEAYFALLYLGIIALAWRRLRRDPVPAAGKLLCSLLIAVPVAVMVYSMVKNNVQGPLRYVSMLSIPLLLLWGYAWAEAGEVRRGWAIRTALALAIMVHFALESANQGEWHRETLQYIKRHRTTDQAILACSRSNNLFALYYHGVEGGWSGGIESSERRVEIVKRDINYMTHPWDSSFLLWYHGKRVPMQRAVDELLAEGFYVGARKFAPTDEVTLWAVARTPKGLERINALPDLGAPRLTDSAPE